VGGGNKEPLRECITAGFKRIKVEAVKSFHNFAGEESAWERKVFERDWGGVGGPYHLKGDTVNVGIGGKGGGEKSIQMPIVLLGVEGPSGCYQ